MFELGADIIHHFFQGHSAFLAFFPRFEDNGQFRAGLVCPDTGATSCHALHICHGRVFLQVIDGTFRHLAGAFQRGTLGQRQFYFEISLVFLRQETTGDYPVQHDDEDDSHSEPGNDSSGVGESPLQKLNVFVIPAGEPLVDFTEHEVLLPVRRA